MGVMYQTLGGAEGASYPEARDSITNVVLVVICAAIAYLAVALVLEVGVLATEASRKRKLAASKRGSGKGKAVGAGGARVLEPAGRGSMYERADSLRRGGGALETSFNPMSLKESARALSPRGLPVGGGGAAVGSADALDIAKSVASLAEPPPPEVWCVVQAAFASLTEQVADAATARALAARAGAASMVPVEDTNDPASPRNRDGGGGGRRQAFSPQATGGGGGSGGADAMAAFRPSQRKLRTAR